MGCEMMDDKEGGMAVMVGMDMDQMLEDYMAAKSMEADPKHMEMMRDYAMKKKEQLEEFLKTAGKDKPKAKLKSFKDLKQVYDEKVKEDLPKEEGE